MRSLEEEPAVEEKLGEAALQNSVAYVLNCAAMLASRDLVQAVVGICQKFPDVILPVGVELPCNELVRKGLKAPTCT